MGTDVFAALASPARREILRLLLDGPRPAGELATHFEMSRPSVSEHLRLLRDAGLVSERRSGRHRYYHLEPARLAELRDWLAPYERFWRGRLRQLRSLLDDESRDEGFRDENFRDEDSRDDSPDEWGGVADG